MPTTVISPTIQNLNKVSGDHDCLEYTFQNDDAVLAQPVKDKATIEVFADEIPFADGIVISNNDPVLTSDIKIIRDGGASLDGYTFTEPNASANDRAIMVRDAFRANPYLNSRYDIFIDAGTPTIVEIEAKEAGSEYTLSFEFISGVGPFPWMTIQELYQGSEVQIEDDFSFVIQLWENIGSSAENFINEWLVPGLFDDALGEVVGKFDLAKVADLYLSHSKPEIAQSNIVKIDGLAGRYFLKHAVAYTEIDGAFRPFNIQQLASVKVFKGTSRRLAGIDTSLFATGATGQKFITSMPIDGQYTFSCAAVLWLYLYIPDGTTNINTYVQIDTDSGVIGPNLVHNVSVGITEGIYSFPAGPGNLGLPALQTPGVISYEIWAEVTDGSGTWETERASFQVDVSCRNNVQFFFRNQCGTIDTIEFRRIVQGSLLVRSNEHCQFIQCGDPICDEGIQISRATSYEVFQAIADVHAKYGEDFIKDFYRSAWKGTLVNGQLVTIIPRSAEYAISRTGELNLQSIFDYRYNFEEKQ